VYFYQVARLKIFQPILYILFVRSSLVRVAARRMTSSSSSTWIPTRARRAPAVVVAPLLRRHAGVRIRVLRSRAHCLLPTYPHLLWLPITYLPVNAGLGYQPGLPSFDVNLARSAHVCIPSSALTSAPIISAMIVVLASLTPYA